ncbi:MAG: hypothetical protein ACOC8K_03085, partial [Gemmatimonadota bacterium]
PPYIAREEAGGLAPEVAEWEPDAALYAGPDGLEILRPLIREAHGVLHRGGLLALEMASTRAEAVSALVRETGSYAEATVRKDLAGRDRILLAVRR